MVSSHTHFYAPRVPFLGDFHNYNRIKEGVIAIIIGIDHGYSAIKTRQACFPTGITRYEYGPYTMQNVLQYKDSYYVCGTRRQTLVKDKSDNENYYLLTMVAITQEMQKRGGERTAKLTGLSRGFFYKNPVIRQEMDRAVEQQAEMIDPRRGILNMALEKQNTLLQQQIIHLKREIEDLKKENEKLQKVLKKKDISFIKNL